MNDPTQKHHPSPCPEWEEKLACTRLDNFSLGERAAFKAHMRDCRDCPPVWEEYRQQDEIIRQLYTPQSLPGLPPQLLRLWETPPRRSWWNNLKDTARSWGGPVVIPIGFGILTYLISLGISSFLSMTPLKTIVLTLLLVLAVLVLGVLIVSRTDMEETQRKSNENDYRYYPLTHLKSEGVAPLGPLQKSAAKIYRTLIDPHLLIRPKALTPVRSIWRRGKVQLTLFLSVLAIFGSLLLASLYPGDVRAPHLALPTGIGATTVGGEYVGLSNGMFCFDTNRSDGYLKRLAGEKLTAGDVPEAQSLWSMAIATDTSDAEARIYQENQRVLSLGRPHVTLIVGTILGSGYTGLSRDALQGAYIAQQEINNRADGAFQVRLLIANTGPDANTTSVVAQQIVQAAQSDPSILGVMGWPTSDTSLAATKILEAAHIPLVSATASSDTLTGISPYFFRVAPSNRDQAAVGAQYAEETLQTRRVVVFYDEMNSYSRTLATDFAGQLSNITVVKEPYTVGQPQSILTHLSEALASRPDLIYFAGYADDAGVLLSHLPACQATSCVRIMGGDGLYTPGDYPLEAHAYYANLYFTAFAYPDEWSILHLNAPSFLREYAASFDPNGSHQQSPYGYSRPDGNAILAYDATKVLMHASQTAFTQNGKRATPQATRNALAQISGSAALQEVSGQISFDPNGDAQGKAVVMLSVNDHGQAQLKKVVGRFLKNA